MDVNKIKESLEILKKDLGEGFVTGDVWVTGSGQPICSHNSGNSKAAALFDQITLSIQKALELAKFAEIDPYYLFHVDNGMTIVVLLHGKYQWGLLVDTEKSPLGLLLNVVIPGVLDKLNEA